eukprot:SAG22_NODE_3094_length_1945_cov_1.432052_3_plen_77_part_00
MIFLMALRDGLDCACRPVDGQPGSGLLTPNACHLKNQMGRDINHALDALRAAGVKVTHYVHTRVTNYPNGSCKTKT